MLIVTIAYDLLLFAFSFVVGLVALIFYLDKKKSGKLQIGMLLIAIAFLVSSFLGLLNGITVTTYLSDQGWEAQQIGLYSTIVGLVSRISFTIMILTGLYILHKETT